MAEEKGVYELLKHFEESLKIDRRKLSIDELEKRGIAFIETHRKNPQTYKTTDEWQNGYLQGYMRVVDMLRSAGYTEI